MKVNRILFFSLISFSICQAYGQDQDFNYKRKLDGISATWHTIILDNEVFVKSAKDLKDLRILGIDQNNDTLEVPYMLNVLADKLRTKEISFKLINQATNAAGKYYTFEIPEEQEVNQIHLDFNKENFDWQVVLEGSQDLNDWFTILQDYRILSIKNATADYTFTKLIFPVAKFKYLRLLVKGVNTPGFEKAAIFKKVLQPGDHRNYTIRSFSTSENDTNNETILDVQLAQYVPVATIKLDIDKQFDFYRPLTVQYLVDSIKGPNGWNYNYQNVYRGTLSSLENNEITLNQTKAQKFRIIIDNHDNTPLVINGVSAHGNLYQLTGRFLKPANYYLFYGNKSQAKPDYDISHFQDKIPTTLTPLQVGPEELIPHQVKTPQQPLFANKTWLWGIMILIIGVLGWFSLKMIRNQA